jgi:hypothetical protein
MFGSNRAGSADSSCGPVHQRPPAGLSRVEHERHPLMPG